MRVICFHDPQGENGYLSNWYPCEFTVDGKKFTSSEQYFMYRKALLFKDEGAAKRIMAVDDCQQIQQIGRRISNYNDKVWNGYRQLIMYEGLRAKFSQNPELKKKLLDTGNEVLAEASLSDRIWGIGLRMNDSRIFSMKNWQDGRNLLGFTLMKVREDLKK
ncbi:MAG: NADAR family protein [Erysipelotrichaceae bacterium]|nr:NADAR family protein [Erysipelotrichaceae bacterium]